MPANTSPPILAQYPSSHLTIGAGVAIFHLATSRVVLCYHTREHYWFLPKGRRNANEITTQGAEREGFEESGYRNRVLPLPLKHRQTQPEGERRVEYVREPVWTQLLPLTSTAQYLLFWYVAETVTKEMEEGYEDGGSEAGKRVYVPPEPFPEGMTLKQRMALDRVVGENGVEKVYEPVRHEGTGVDEDELCYTSCLMEVEEARRKLRGSVMEDVVRRGWEAIQLRLRMEVDT
jgi:hypothetical protein